MKDAVIVVGVPKELKESLSRYGVEISKVVRKALEDEVKRRRVEELKRVAGELGSFFAKISDEEIVKTVRESREPR